MSVFWLFYFLVSILIVGSTLAYGVSLPFLIIGRLYHPAWVLAGRIFQSGVALLMKGQPWFNAKIDIVLPKAPFVTLSNHRSHLDMFILLAMIPNIRVIAKHTLFYIPFLGFMMRLLKNIPIRKGDLDSYWKALETVKRALKEKDPVHIFPEMTRCSAEFNGIQSFQLAPFHALLSSGVPIIPILFRGTDKVWPKGQLGLHYRRPVLVRSLSTIDPSQFKTAEELRDHVHQQLLKEWNDGA